MLRVELKPAASSAGTVKTKAKDTGGDNSFEELFIQKKEESGTKGSGKTAGKKDTTGKAENISQTEDKISGNPEEEVKEEILSSVDLGLMAAMQAAAVPEGIVSVPESRENLQDGKNSQVSSLPVEGFPAIKEEKTAQQILPVQTDPEEAGAEVQAFGSAELPEEAVPVKMAENTPQADTAMESVFISEKNSGLEQPVQRTPAEENSGERGQQMLQRNDADSGQTELSGAGGEQTVSGLSSAFSASQPAEVMSAAQGQTPVYKMATTQNQMIPDLGQALSEHIPSKNGELVLELQPASLGKLTIRVLYEAGRAEVSIMSDNAKTLEILGQHSQQLGAILKQNTGQDTVVYTGNYGQQNEESFERQGGAGDNPQREGQQEHRRRQAQADSFAQQLRLGLV